MKSALKRRKRTQRGAKAPGTVVPLPSGRSVAVAAVEEEGVTVRSPTGEVELTIRFEAAGPVVRISSGAIHLLSDTFVNVECERFRVNAREGILLETPGDLNQKVGGDCAVVAQGAARVEGREVKVEAREGEATVEAAGDTSILGRNVKINC